MSETPNLQLPYILPSQAQKHVTHNEALQALDALVQLSVLDRDLAAPPASPAEGDRYLVAAAASGDWTGESGSIAAFIDGNWRFHQPAAGWIAHVADESVHVFFDGDEWLALAGEGAPVWGVNAQADATNRLTVAAPATLLSHDGSDHRLKVSKASAIDTASLLFQSAFEGRAEFGLAGSDDFSVKVSSDGAGWREAMMVEAATGRAWFPATPLEENLLVNGRFTINQRLFAGGALAAGLYGFDRWKAGGGGADVSRSGETVTLNSGSIVQRMESGLLAGAAAAQHVFTVEDLAGGALVVGLGNDSATLQPGVGSQSVALTPAAGGHLTLTLSPLAGAVTFGGVSLTAGATPAACRQRPLDEEMRLCRRYYSKVYNNLTPPADASSGPGYHLGVCYSANNIATQRIAFTTPMRTAPALTFFAPNTGQPTSPGLWQALGPSLNYANASAMSISDNGERGFVANLTVPGAVAGSAYLLCGGWSAETEL